MWTCAGAGLEKELPHFEALFTPPSGLFVLAFVDDALAGCAGLLVLHGHTAEVKRVYVRPAHRGLGLGEALVRRLMALAPTLNVNHLILDAVAPTTHAQLMYQRMGFTETPPYYANPAPDTRFFRIPPAPFTRNGPTMFVVIFRATARQLDAEYSATAARLARTWR
jgi:putative acetyltransferase